MSLSLDDEDAQPEKRQKERFAAFAKMFGEGRSFSGHERNCCYLNPGLSPAAEEQFANISAASGIDFPDDARALALSDWDQDGDLDLWISNRNAPRLRFLRNEIPQSGHFLSLHLVGNGKATNRDAIGARVELVLEETESESQPPKSIQTLRAGEGFLAQNSKWLHFGLGDATRVEKVVVDWPGGQKEEFSDVAIDSRNILLQGTGKAKQISPRSRELALAAGDEPVVDDPQTTVLRMITPIAMPDVSYQTWEGKDRVVGANQGQPLLISLWASWCKPCLQELSQMAAAHEELRAADLKILALSVDGVGDDQTDPEASRRVLESIGFPFDSGRATKELLQGLQQMHDRQAAGRRPLPLPTSVLLDSQGRLEAFYKGPVEIQEILRHLAHEGDTIAERFHRSASIPGRMLQHETAREMLRIAEAEQQFETADLFQKNRRWEQAINQYNTILKLWSDRTLKNLNNRSPLNEQEHQRSGAQRQMEKQRQIYSMAYSGRAHVNQRLGRLDAAIADYDQVIKLMPNESDAHNNRGIINHKLGKNDLALEDHTRAISLNPNNATSYLRRGNIYQNLENYPLAVADYTRAIKLKPDEAPAHKRRGDTYKKMGDYKLATADYTRAIELNPSNRFAYKERGKILVKLRKYNEALADFSKAIQFHSNDAETYNNRGLIYVALNRFGLAQNDFANSIRLNPHNPAAYNNLAWLLATCKNSAYRSGEKAIAAGIQACELLGWKNVDALDTLAAAYAETGQFDKAIQWQNKALELAEPQATGPLESRLKLYQAGKPYQQGSPD